MKINFIYQSKFCILWGRMVILILFKKSYVCVNNNVRKGMEFIINLSMLFFCQ